MRVCTIVCCIHRRCAAVWWMKDFIHHTDYYIRRQELLLRHWGVPRSSAASRIVRTFGTNDATIEFKMSWIKKVTIVRRTQGLLRQLLDTAIDFHVWHGVFTPGVLGFTHHSLLLLDLSLFAPRLVFMGEPCSPRSSCASDPQSWHRANKCASTLDCRLPLASYAIVVRGISSPCWRRSARSIHIANVAANQIGSQCCRTDPLSASHSRECCSTAVSA